MTAGSARAARRWLDARGLRGALLSFRIQRFETVVIAFATIASVLVSALVISAINAPTFAACRGEGEAGFSAVCQTGIFPWLSRIARLSLAIVPIFPIVAGLLAGAPIVARELEAGTARLAWSLGPSRMRWFVQRAAPIFVLVLAASLAIGATADALAHLLFPGVDLDASFASFRGRGLLVAAQALLVTSVALAVGAILGRAAPTLVLALILVGGIGIAVDKVERVLLTNEAVIADGETYAWSNDDLYVDGRLRLADGAIVSYEEAMARHPELQMGWDETAGIRNVVLYIPGSRYHDVERREAAALLGLTAAFIALAGVRVMRRRPR